MGEFSMKSQQKPTGSIMNFYHIKSSFYIGDLDETMVVDRENIPAINKEEINLIISIFKLFRSCNSSSEPGLGNYRTYKKDYPYFIKISSMIESKIQEGIDNKFPSFLALLEEKSEENSLFELFVEDYQLECHEDSLYWAYDSIIVKASNDKLINVTDKFS
jgi:hypothetical protein